LRKLRAENFVTQSLNAMQSTEKSGLEFDSFLFSMAGRKRKIKY